MTLEEKARDEERRLKPVDMSALADCVIDPIRYAINKILPRGYVTLLGAHGGAGKSLQAEILSAHVATGMTYAGLHTDQGNVVFASLEDPGDINKFRMRKICDEYGLSHVEVAERVRMLDGSDSDNALAIELSSAGVKHLAFTDALDEIEAAAKGCLLLVIDNASDAFDANGSDTRLVRSFIRRLTHIARKHDCAILLLAHIDKAAARFGASGNSYIGSTAWHNTVRSRLALIEDDAGLSLVHEKSNHGKKIDPIRLEWTDHGVLVPVATTGAVAVERAEQDDAAALAAIEAAIRDGATVHAARSGNYSTLSVLKTYPDLPKELRKDKARFWAALTRLERAGRVFRETYRNEQRKERVRLLCAAPVPHTPHTGAGAGRAGAPVDRSTHWRGTGALAHCQRCDGSGCEWCRERP